VSCASLSGEAVYLLRLRMSSKEELNAIQKRIGETMDQKVAGLEAENSALKQKTLRTEEDNDALRAQLEEATKKFKKMELELSRSRNLETDDSEENETTNPGSARHQGTGGKSPLKKAKLNFLASSFNDNQCPPSTSKQAWNWENSQDRDNFVQDDNHYLSYRQATTRSTPEIVATAIASLNYNGTQLKFDSRRPHQAEVYVSACMDVCDKMRLDEEDCIKVFLSGFNNDIANKAIDWKKGITKEMETMHISLDTLIKRFLNRYSISSESTNLKSQVFTLGKHMIPDKEGIVHFIERIQAGLPADTADQMLPSWNQRLRNCGYVPNDAQMLDKLVSLHTQHTLLLTQFLGGLPPSVKTRMETKNIPDTETDIDAYIREASRADLTRLRMISKPNSDQLKMISTYMRGTMTVEEVMGGEAQLNKAFAKGQQYHVQSNNDKHCRYCNRPGHVITTCNMARRDFLQGDQNKPNEQSQRNNDQQQSGRGRGYWRGRNRGRNNYRQGSRTNHNNNNNRNPTANVNATAEVQQDGRYEYDQVQDFKDADF